MNWEEMCRIEPLLAEFERDAIEFGPDPQYSNYEALKMRISSLVGWDAQDERLRGDEAWRIAMEHTAMRCAP